MGDSGSLKERGFFSNSGLQLSRAVGTQRNQNKSDQIGGRSASLKDQFFFSKQLNLHSKDFYVWILEKRPFR